MGYVPGSNLRENLKKNVFFPPIVMKLKIKSILQPNTIFTLKSYIFIIVRPYCFSLVKHNEVCEKGTVYLVQDLCPKKLFGGSTKFIDPFPNCLEHTGVV